MNFHTALRVQIRPKPEPDLLRIRVHGGSKGYNCTHIRHNARRTCGGKFSHGLAGVQVLRLSGLRLVWLPAGASLAPKPLAGRVAALESLQQLRAALPRPVEHDVFVPAIDHPCRPAASVVCKSVLFGSSAPGWFGDVLSCAKMDREFPRGVSSRNRLRIQRPDSVLVDVAQQHRRPWVDAMGGVAGK